MSKPQAKRPGPLPHQQRMRSAREQQQLRAAHQRSVGMYEAIQGDGARTGTHGVEAAQPKLDTFAGVAERGRPCQDSESLARDLRAVASDAANHWARDLGKATAGDDAEGYGKAVAKVYLAALRALNAGFAPDAGSPAERV